MSAPPSVYRVRKPALPPPRRGVEPLTHHAILALAAPFSRKGWRVDLAASDRAERRLLFKPRGHDLEIGSIEEQLTLEQPAGRGPRLSRTLRHPGGLEATAVAEGAAPEALLAALELLAPAEQFARTNGGIVAYGYRLRRDGDAPGGWRAEVRSATAHPGGLDLTLDTRPDSGSLGRFELRRRGDHPRDLPDDILAIQGLAWRPLRPKRGGWSGSVALARREPERSRDARAKMEHTVAHLTAILSQPPADYHPGRVRARWGVVGRRAAVLLAGLLFLAAAPLLMLLPVENASAMRMLAFHLPPLMLVALFTLREIPSIMPPPIPRRLRDDAWRPSCSEASPGEPHPTPAGNAKHAPDIAE